MVHIERLGGLGSSESFPRSGVGFGHCGRLVKRRGRHAWL